LVYFTVVNNNPLDSQFDVVCVDNLLSTVLIDSAMSAYEFLNINIILT